MRKLLKPSKIRLEASSVCQLRCPVCPTAGGVALAFIRPGFLKPDHFGVLLDKNPHLREIELSNYGEIFLNSEMLEIMRIAAKKGVSLTADNGVNLNSVSDEVLEGLTIYNFKSITCSIDGASQETYGKYRKGGNFGTVIENVSKINGYKARHCSDYPVLVWQFILFGHNQHELPKAREMATSLSMEFRVKLSWDDKISQWSGEIAEKECGAASRLEFKKMHGKDYMHGLCNELWDSPQINWDGRVLGCCRNFWEEFGGNAFLEGLQQAVNSEKISYARGMVEGKYIQRDGIPCTTCDIYKTMKESGNWIVRAGKNNFQIAGLLRRKIMSVISRLVRREGRRS